ncbi:hypothetical protein EV2_027729 [Malus domestica]
MLKLLSSSSACLHAGRTCTRLCSSTSTSTTPTSPPFNLPLISELIEKQHWSEFKTHLKDSSFVTVARQLFDAGADSKIILRYFTWSQKDHKFTHHLELTCRLLHSLANVKEYSDIRAFLDRFVRSHENHSVSSIFHLLAMGGSQFCANCVIVDMLVLAYVKNMRTRLGFEAFQRAGDYGFKLSKLACNPLLSGLVKENEIGCVEYVYKEIIRRRIEADLFTFNIVINGMCKVGKLNKARDITNDMKARGIPPNVVTYNSLIDGYCKMGGLGKMHKADAILKEMVAYNIRPNEITFNILIDGFCKDENVASALKVFEEMKQGLKPNVVTYNSLINGLCCNGKLDEACGLRDEMLRLGLKPNIVTYNALINGFCKKKRMKEARELFDDIRNQGKETWEQPGSS